MAQNKKLIFSCLLIVLIFCQEIQSIQGRHLKLGKKNVFPKLQVHNKMLEKETRKINNAKPNNNLHVDLFPAVNVAANANLMSPPAAPSVAVGETLPPPPPRYVDDFRPTAPGHSPGVGHSFALDQQSAESKFVSSNTQKARDFQHTSPGISPGVGHSFAQDQQNAESKLESDNSWKAHDFRPTSPGTSHGVGHSFSQHQQNAESKLVSDNSLKAHDFRPTSPGNSPGVGHSLAQNQQNAESKLVTDDSQKAGYFMTGVKDDFRPTTPGHSPGIGHALRNKNAGPNA